MVWPRLARTAVPQRGSSGHSQPRAPGPDLVRIVRRSGGTIAPDGGPLATARRRRIRQWRQKWLTLPSQVIPAVIDPGQVARPGLEGLGYLADFARQHCRPAAAPARACWN